MGLHFDERILLRDFHLVLLCFYYHITGAGRRYGGSVLRTYHLALNRDKIKERIFKETNFKCINPTLSR
jgi:hypothetical protein